MNCLFRQRTLFLMWVGGSAWVVQGPMPHPPVIAEGSRARGQQAPPQANRANPQGLVPPPPPRGGVRKLRPDIDAFDQVSVRPLLHAPISTRGLAPGNIRCHMPIATSLPPPLAPHGHGLLPRTSPHRPPVPCLRSPALPWPVRRRPRTCNAQVMVDDASPFMSDYHKARGDTKLNLSPWRCVGVTGTEVKRASQAWAGTRRVSWESVVWAPNKKVVEVLEEQLFVFCRTPDSALLVVQHASCTPGVPYGSSFRVELSFQASVGLSNGKPGVNLTIHSHVHFLQSTILGRIIRSTAAKVCDPPPLGGGLVEDLHAMDSPRCPPPPSPRTPPPHPHTDSAVMANPPRRHDPQTQVTRKTWHWIPHATRSLTSRSGSPFFITQTNQNPS